MPHPHINPDPAVRRHVRIQSYLYLAAVPIAVLSAILTAWVLLR